jgi:hypothetical protein
VPVRHNQGLSTGIFETDSFFKIQLRDEFSNVITKGPIREVQIITIDANSGEFTVSLSSDTTEFLQVGVSENDMENALEKLGSIENITVSKSVISGTESQYTVTFESRDGDLLPMQINSTGISKNTGTASASVDNCDWYKVQSITTGVVSGTLSGTFYIEYQGSRTIDLASNITATDMKAELEQLPNIITAIVSRTGPSVYEGFVYTVTLASVETARSQLHAESHLLEGNEPFSTVALECPTGTAAGRVGEEFVVELKGQNVVLGDANYLGQGVYKVKYFTPESGTYSMKVARALRGGLSGTYYNNRWLYGTAALQRTDPTLNFMWSSYITPTGKDYISVRWSGYIEPAFTQIYTFYAQVNDGIKLWIDEELIIDSFESTVNDTDVLGYLELNGVTSKSLVGGRLYKIKIEYRENTGPGVMKLFWSSITQPKAIVPSNRLFYSDVDIVSSPFTVVPVGVKPTQPLNSAVSIHAKDELLIKWKHPANYGGNAVKK